MLSQMIRYFGVSAVALFLRNRTRHVLQLKVCICAGRLPIPQHTALCVPTQNSPFSAGQVTFWLNQPI